MQRHPWLTTDAVGSSTNKLAYSGPPVWSALDEDEDEDEDRDPVAYYWAWVHGGMGACLSKVKRSVNILGAWSYGRSLHPR